MSNYNVGDKFVIEIEKAFKDEKEPFGLPVLYRIKGFNALVFDEFGLDKLQKLNPKKKIEDIDDMLAEHEIRREAFNAGMQKAWEMGKIIYSPFEEGGMPIDEIKKRFGCSCSGVIFKFTPQETKAIIEAWQEETKIKVGDVVKKDDISGVVLDLCSEDEFHVLTENGCVETWGFENVVKTDKHFNIPIIISQLGSVRR